MKKNLLVQTRIRFLFASAIIMLIATTSASAANFTAVASGNWSSAVTWGGSAPGFSITGAQITIPAGVEVTLDNNLTVSGNLASVNVMGSLSSASNVSLSMVSGTVTGTGSISVGSISFATGSTLLFTGSLNVNTLVNTAYNLQAAAMITVQNTLALASGTLSVVTGGTITLSGNSTIVISGGMLSLAGGTVGLSSSYNVVYTGGSATAGLELSGTGLNNVTVNVSPGSSVTLTADLAVSGSLSLTSGALVLNGNNLSITGDISASGSGTISSTAGSNISINTTVSPSGSLSFTAGANTVNNLTVNIGSASGSVSIGSNVVVQGSLNFISGSVNIGNNTLEIAASGSVNGAGAASYVITGSTGSLAMNISAAMNGWVSFAIGTSAQFAPVSIQLNPGSAGGTFSAGVAANVLANGTAGADISISQPVVDATWHIESDVSADLDINLEMMWSAAMEVNAFNNANAYISHYTQGSWDTDVSASATVEANGMFSMQRNGIQSLSPFGVFDGNTITSVPAGNAAENVRIYPNPATTKLYVMNASGSAEVFTVEIMNLQGQIVNSLKLEGNANSVPVEMLNKGTYFIKVYNDKVSRLEKFTKI